MPGVVGGVEGDIPGGGAGGGTGVGGGAGGGAALGQKFIYVDGLNDHCPAAVKSLGPRLFVVEWHAEQEPTSGTVGLGAHAAATADAIALVAKLCVGNKITIERKTISDSLTGKPLNQVLSQK
jgi:hypothetical protein